MTSTYPSARHHFASQRRSLRVLMAGVILLPALILAAWAWVSLQSAFANAELEAARLARIVQEQASKVFEINHLANARVRDLTRGWSNVALKEHESQMHARLREIAEQLPQASSLSVFGDDGMLLASSRFFPVSPVSIADREDFRAILVEHRPIHVSGVLLGRVVSEPIFNVSMPRLDPDGHVLGMVAVSLRPAYFSTFYGELLSQDPSFAAALVLRDGSVLASFPSRAADGNPDHGTAQTERTLGEALAKRFQSEPAGVLRTLGIGGADSLVAHRALDKGALQAVVSVPIDAIRAQWRRQLYVAALICAVPALGLWLLTWMSLRRLQREEQAWQRWRDEVGRREVAEDRYRQARKLEAVGRLMASVSHDFRNVLSVISFNADLIALRAQGPVAAREKALDGIRKGLANGTSLANQLLGMARKREHRKEPIAIAGQRDEWTPLIQATLGSSVELRYALAPDCSHVLADKSELELVLVNLASNARDAMPRGGVFEVTAVNVWLDGTQGGGMLGSYVCIGARDTGCGMAPEVAAHAFDPLFTTKAPGIGTGLGLTQVRDFCRETDGWAAVTSAPGQGTTIKLYLPAQGAPDAGPDAEMPVRVAEPRGRLALLLVTNDLSTVRSALESLARVGVSVHVATNERDATAQLRRNGFDLVVVDARLGRTLAGLALRHTLGKRFPFLPSIVMTDEADLLAVASLSDSPVLVKPWNAHTLHRAGVIRLTPTEPSRQPSC